jgi:hypothetical protein
MIRSSSAVRRAGLALAVAALAIGCASAHQPSQSESLAQPSVPADRKVVRSGELTVTVDTPEDATGEVERIVEEAGGFVERSTSTKGANCWVHARVPAARLEQIMDAIAGLGDEESRSVSAADATDQYVDLQTRLRNNIELRDRLQRLLDRAKDVDDVLAIEKELNRIQSEIETMQARFDRLNSEVELSGLSVRLQRKRILGPLGYLAWGLSKLFVIR